MKKYYQRFLLILVLFSMLVTAVPPKTALLAEEIRNQQKQVDLSGTQSESPESETDQPIDESISETLLQSTENRSTVNQTEDVSSAGEAEITDAQGNSVDISKQTEQTIETEISQEETAVTDSAPSKTDEKESLVPEKTEPSETKIANPLNNIESTKLSFRVAFKDGGFIFSASTRILPKLALYRGTAETEDELLATNIEEYFRYVKQGNSYAYTSKTDLPVADVNGQNYIYTVQPVFISNTSLYVDDVSSDSNEKDRYYTLQKELDITSGTIDTDKQLILTAASDMRFKMVLTGDVKQTLPEPQIKSIYQSGILSKDGNYYEANKDYIQLTLQSETANSKEYAIDYLPKYDPTSILGQSSYEFQYGFDLEDIAGFRLLKVEPGKNSDLGNLYPEQSVFTYTALGAFTFTKVWNDGETNETRGFTPQFQLWQTIEGKSTQVKSNQDFPEPQYDENSPDQKWTYTFSDLPLVDKDGQTITYFVKEINLPDDYTVGTYNFETNTLINSKAVDFNFSIVWNDNNQVKNRAPEGMNKTPIEILQNGGHYQVNEILVNPDDPDDPKIPELKTLGKAGENAYRVHKLPVADETLQDYLYTFRVKTEDLPNYNWFVKDKDGDGWRSLTPKELETGLTEDQVLRADLKIPVRFTKTWHDASTFKATRPLQDEWLQGVTVWRRIRGSDPKTPFIQVENTALHFVTRQNEAGEEIGLQDSISWFIEAESLPAFDGEGNPYDYIFREKDPKSEDTNLGEYDTTPAGDNANIANGGTSLSRIAQKITIDTTKYWIDDKTPDDRPTVSFYLFRFPENVHHPEKGENAFEILAPVPDYSPVTLAEPEQKLSANKIVLMKDVDRYDTYGNEYVYYAYESMTNADYTNYIDNGGTEVQQVEAMPRNKKGTDFFVLNHGSVYNLDFDLIDVTFEKFWNAKSLQQLNGAIQVKLQSKLTTDSDTEWKDVPDQVMTLDGFAAYAMTREGTFKNLPAYALENFDLSDLDASDTEAVKQYVESFKKDNKLQYRVREVAATIDAEDKTAEDFAQVDENNHFEDGGHEFEVRYEDIAVDNFTRITNNIMGKMSLEVIKTWEPALTEGTTGEIEIVILRNDELEWDASEISFTNHIKKAETWSNTNPAYVIEVGADQKAIFENLPKYDATGRLYTYKVRESKHFPADYTSNTVNYAPDEVNNLIKTLITNYKGKPSDPETTPGAGGTVTIPNGSSMSLQFMVEKKWQDDSDLKGRVEVTLGLFSREQAEGSHWVPEIDPQTGQQITWNLNSGNSWIENVLTPELPGGKDYTVREVNSAGFTVGIVPSENEFLIDGDSAKTQEYLESGSYTLGHTDRMKFHIKTDFTDQDGILHFVVTNTRYALEEIPVVKEWYIDAILANDQFKKLLAKANAPAGYEPKLENFVAHFELQDVNTTEENPLIYAKYDLHAPAEGTESSFRFGTVVDETNATGVAKGKVEVVNQFDEIGGYIDYKVVETKLSYVDEEKNIQIALPFIHRQRAYLNEDNLGDSDYVQNAQKSENYKSATTWEDKDKAVLSYEYENTIRGINRLYLKKVWRDTGSSAQKKLRPDISLKVYRYTEGEPDPSRDERINLAVPQWDATKTNGDSSTWYWKTTFDNMDKYDGEGKLYQYYAVETLVNNTNYKDTYYNQKGTWSNPDENGQSAKAVFPRQFGQDGKDLEAIYRYAEIKPDLDEAGIIINTPYDEESFSGEKIWGLPDKDWFQKSDGFPKVTFKLYRIHDSYIKRVIHNQGKPDQYTEILHKETGKPLTIDSPHVEEAFCYEGKNGERIPKEAIVVKQGGTDSDYKFTINRLPSMDDYGDGYYYFSREVKLNKTGENTDQKYEEAQFNTYIVQADDSTRKISNVYKPDEEQILSEIDVTKTWKWPEEYQRQGQYPTVKFTLNRQTLKAGSNDVQLNENELAYVVVPGGDISGKAELTYQVKFNKDGSITVIDNLGKETHYTENIEGKVKVFPGSFYYYSQTDTTYVYRVSESVQVPSGGSQNAYITTDSNTVLQEGQKAEPVSQIKTEFTVSEKDKLATGTVGFTNTFNEQNKPAQAKKIWADMGHTELRPASPEQAFESFVLRRKTNGKEDSDATFSPVAANLTAEVVIISDEDLAKALQADSQAYAGKWTKPSETSNTWTYHFPGNYPTYDTAGNYYAYYVIEELKEPYATAYKLTSSQSTTPSNTSSYGTASLTNSLETISPELEKQWYLKEGDNEEDQKIKIESSQVLKYLQRLGGLPEKLSFKLESRKGGHKRTTKRIQSACRPFFMR